METETYNGWTNYATWRINLELVNNNEYIMELASKLDTYDLSRSVEETCISYMDNEEGTIAHDYAMAFINDVNWYEIAEHIKEALDNN